MIQGLRSVLLPMIVVVLAFAWPVLAEEGHTEAGHGDGTHEAAVTHDEHDAHGEHAGDTHAMDAHGDSHGAAHDEHAEHGDDHGGGGVMGILAHHLIDAPYYDLPWGQVKLPKIPINIPFLGITDGIQVTKHKIGLSLAALLAILFFVPGMGRTRKGEVPHGWSNFLEVLVVFVRDEVVYANLGEKDGRKWLPVFLTAFFLILFSNLLGMIPWGTTATGNVNVTAGLAIAMLLMVFWAGFSNQGLKYIASFVPHGVPIFVAPILFPIEVFGLFVKHFALCIRLFANMLAGHTIIAVFLALILTPLVALASVPGAVAISMLELFVAFLQSYVFVMLASLFVGMAIHPH